MKAYVLEVKPYVYELGLISTRNMLHLCSVLMISIIR